jgi:hypothetical protein
MDQELQVRIAPITSRLWMLAPKPVQAPRETRPQSSDASGTTGQRRRPGQLIRTSA